MTKTKDGGGMGGDVLVLFTMDVEPAAQADGKTSGPAIERFKGEGQA